MIVTRNVDLSIGSILGLSAYAVGRIFVHHPDVPIVLVILAGAGIGLACGIVNGAIVTLCRVPSLVVTLGTLYVIRGIDASWAGGNQVGASSLPDSFNELGYGKILGVPYLGIITIVCVAIATYAMRTFRSGRDLYAIGSNPEAARLAGHPGRSPRVRRLRPQRRDRGLRGRALARRSSARSTRPPARATSSRSSPRSSSAASRSSAAAAACSGPRSARSCSTRSRARSS